MLPPGRPWPAGGKVTLHAGDPCPFCGQAEAHETLLQGGDYTVCQPGAARRAAGEVAYALLFGMEEAARLLHGRDLEPLAARLAELRTQAALADDIPHDGLYRGATLPEERDYWRCHLHNVYGANTDGSLARHEQVAHGGANITVSMIPESEATEHGAERIPAYTDLDS